MHNKTKNVLSFHPNSIYIYTYARQLRVDEWAFDQADIELAQGTCLDHRSLILVLRVSISSLRSMVSNRLDKFTRYADLDPGDSQL